MVGPNLSAGVCGQVPPEGHRSSRRPEQHRRVPREEGRGAPCRGVAEPGHGCGQDVAGCRPGGLAPLGGGGDTIQVTMGV